MSHTIILDSDVIESRDWRTFDDRDAHHDRITADLESGHFPYVFGTEDEFLAAWERHIEAGGVKAITSTSVIDWSDDFTPPF